MSTPHQLETLAAELRIRAIADVHSRASAIADSFELAIRQVQRNPGVRSPESMAVTCEDREWVRSLRPGEFFELVSHKHRIPVQVVALFVNAEPRGRRVLAGDTHGCAALIGVPESAYASAWADTRHACAITGVQNKTEREIKRAYAELDSYPYVDMVRHFAAAVWVNDPSRPFLPGSTIQNDHHSPVRAMFNHPLFAHNGMRAYRAWGIYERAPQVAPIGNIQEDMTDYVTRIVNYDAAVRRLDELRALALYPRPQCPDRDGVVRYLEYRLSSLVEAAIPREVQINEFAVFNNPEETVRVITSRCGDEIKQFYQDEDPSIVDGVRSTLEVTLIGYIRSIVHVATGTSRGCLDEIPLQMREACGANVELDRDRALQTFVDSQKVIIECTTTTMVAGELARDQRQPANINLVEPDEYLDPFDGVSAVTGEMVEQVRDHITLDLVDYVMLDVDIGASRGTYQMYARYVDEFLRAETQGCEDIVVALRREVDTSRRIIHARGSVLAEASRLLLRAIEYLHPTSEIISCDEHTAAVEPVIRRLLGYNKRV